jgi:hypothetical protein
LRCGLAGDTRLERSEIQAAAAATCDVVAFDKAAQICIEAERLGWRNLKYDDLGMNTISTYANPLMGRLSCAEITTDHVLETHKPHGTTKNDTATRLRGRIESVMDCAVVSGHRVGDNPSLLAQSNTNPPRTFGDVQLTS